MFRHINGAMIKEAFERHGLMVLKQNRSGVKFNGQRIKDAGVGGEMIHVNIRPRDGDILGAFYPPQLYVVVKGTDQYLDFVIYSHPELQDAICTQLCHRYKAHMYAQLNSLGKVPRNWCVCDQVEGRKPGPARGAGPSGAAAFMAALNARKSEKGTADCAHFAKGKCYAVGGKGPKCAFRHDGDPKTIPCGLGAMCKGPSRCGYNHPIPDTEMCAMRLNPWEPD